MTLSSIYADYVNSSKESKVRDPQRLFLSDLGKCPRQIGYRMMETPTDPIGEQEAINKSIMFDLAEHIEEVLMKALGDRVIAYQPDAPISDITPQYKNWGGRADIIADYCGRRVIEVKSVYPGAFKKELDERYLHHHYQAAAYDMYFRDEYKLTADPLLAYFDRGGSNTPQEVDPIFDDYDVMREMDRFEMMRDVLPDLPPKLGKVIELRSWNKEIKLEPDGRCKQPYCKYTIECKQNMSTSTLATRERDRDMWTKKDKAISRLTEAQYKLFDEFLADLAEKEWD